MINANPHLHNYLSDTWKPPDISPIGDDRGGIRWKKDRRVSKNSSSRFLHTIIPIEKFQQRFLFNWVRSAIFIRNEFEQSLLSCAGYQFLHHNSVSYFVSFISIYSASWFGPKSLENSDFLIQKLTKTRNYSRQRFGGRKFWKLWYHSGNYISGIKKNSMQLCLQMHVRESERD